MTDFSGREQWGRRRRATTVMRILHIARTLTVGGIEPHLTTLSVGLRNKGCEVALASDGGRTDTRHGVAWFTAHGIRHYRVPFPGPHVDKAWPWRCLKSVRDLRSAVSDFQPDIVHVHYRATSAYAQGIKLVTGTPFVSTLHIIPIPSGPLHRVMSFWGERAIAISTEVRDYLREVRDYLRDEFRVPERRITLIPHGVDTHYFRPPTPAERSQARTRFDIPQDETVIAMLARMSPEKGHNILLHAMHKLHASGHNSRALLAGVSISGDTRWREEMIRLACDLGLADRVRFLGFSDAREVLWASDILVLPSLWEGFGLAVVEAMLCGVVPVRTPAAGAYEQIVDGQTGFIIPFNDIESLTDRLQLLVRKSIVRKQMAVAARARGEAAFSSVNMVARTLQTYREVIRNA